MAMTAVAVRHVEEEYLYLLVTPCEHCSHGPLVPISVELVDVNGTPVDRVQVQCGNCQHKTVYDFDLTDIQPMPADPARGLVDDETPSRALDLYGWFSMVELMMNAAEKDPDTHTETTRRCIAEARKFYPMGDAPPDSAFWTNDGQADSQANPDLYRRERLDEFDAKLAGESAPAAAGGEQPKKKRFSLFGR